MFKLEDETAVRPNHQWNNFIHAFWFYSTIIGLVYHSGLFLASKDVLAPLAVFLLFEILIGLVVLVHLIELLLIK